MQEKPCEERFDQYQGNRVNGRSTAPTIGGTAKNLQMIQFRLSIPLSTETRHIMC